MFLTFLYRFFEDKHTLRELGYNGNDFFSLKHFLFMGIMLVLIITISILLRKVKKEKIFIIYKVIAIISPLLEIFKITFETHFDLLRGMGFNWGGLLPLYTCSMLMYFMPFVAFGKGNMKQWSMAFFTTIGMLAGFTNFIYLSALNWYPLFTFGALYSAYYHSMLVFVGMSLLITGIYKPTWQTIKDAMIPVILFCVIVVPANYIIKHVTNDTWVDYMMIMNFNGMWVFGKFSDWLDDRGLNFIFTILMVCVGYPIAAALFTAIDIGIIKLIDKFKKKEPKEELELETK